MIDGCGLSSEGWFAIYDHVTRSWKTSQVSLFGEEETYSGTLPPSGTMRNGRLYRRPPLVPRTSGSGSFCSQNSEGHQAEYPTPAASYRYGSSGNGNGGNAGSGARPSLETMARKDLWATPTSRDHADRSAEGTRNVPVNGMLARQVYHGKDKDKPPEANQEFFPTPTAGDSKGSGSRNTGSTARPGISPTDYVNGDGGKGRMWPTPTVQDAENTAGPSQFDRNTYPLNVAVVLSPDGPAPQQSRTWDRQNVRPPSEPSPPSASARVKTIGRLNPRWVEWLMGFPAGWTNFVRSGTLSSRKSPSTPGSGSST